MIEIVFWLAYSVCAGIINWVALQNEIRPSKRRVFFYSALSAFWPIMLTIALVFAFVERYRYKRDLAKHLQSIKGFDERRRVAKVKPYEEGIGR